jgi:hypothetical protein
LIVLVWGALLFSTCSPLPVVDFMHEERMPQLFPDYTCITIPPNLAPTNFAIREKGDEFLVRIFGEVGKEIVIRQSNGNIRIQEKKWKDLLDQNKGKKLNISIAVKRENDWYQYQNIENTVSMDSIDSYLFYRDIVPTNSLWNQMAMHQRDLQSFAEYKLFDNYRIEHNCMNCHTFNRNNPRELLFHVRGNHGGTVFYQHGELSKIDFPMPEILSAGAYCNWHPSGKLVAFAVNQIKQNYYLSGYGDKMKEVFDLASDIVIYDIESNSVLTFPQIASDQRENLPAWSADGQTLYYVTTPPYIPNMPNEDILYSLMEVSFDIETNRLGEPKMMLSAEEIGGSISFPTLSPDGRFMLFCVADFGYFPVNNKSADIYLMDLTSGEYRKPDINSDESESYVSWSSSGRWFVFSSRRLDGMTSKPFLCHISRDGVLSKPFILPQKDPGYYLTDHRNFSRPELINDKVDINFKKLSKIIFSESVTATSLTKQ